MDSELTFANEYVAEALEYGALPYKPPKERVNTEFALHKETDEKDGTRDLLMLGT